jgi:hypothetical protein
MHLDPRKAHDGGCAQRVSGGEIEDIEILRSGRRLLTLAIWAMINRRSDKLSAIGHIRMDGRLSRSQPRGVLVDALQAVISLAGQKIENFATSL